MLCCPPSVLSAKKFTRTSLFRQEASANKPTQVKITMAATSSNEGNVFPTLVGARVENAAKGSGMSGGKRAASQSPTKPRISSNPDGRQHGPERLV